ncbi:polyadenylate-binding protein-interacting protein 9-like [Impatiens glandulifera]|uniref:polyadenylate-binding protein-interacting protein 9-like n=1 Tax=Impatiens glandulifera TaxID=253017 RepID=UPI001FB0EF48|nr:polyadenylate-binding protein-interacting protein 9-like [Impatiens glandulifera]
MAADLEFSREPAVISTTVHSSSLNDDPNPVEENPNVDSKVSDLKSELKMQQLVDALSNLNPMAEEFKPAAYSHDRNHDQFAVNYFVPVSKFVGNEGLSINRRRRNTSNNGRRKPNGRILRAQREDCIRRTVYVSDLDQHVTEERLADLFSQNCGSVADCRICGDPNSRLRFAFVEFDDERSARYAIHLTGTLIGFYPIRVLPSKTAILPVNPTFLPRSEDEKEMCARTVYCTNIDKIVSQVDIKNFFESSCGQVSQLRLLGDNVHSTSIAFVEFVMAESAIEALNCSGSLLGTQLIRVSPSKTPVRPSMGKQNDQNTLTNGNLA